MEIFESFQGKKYNFWSEDKIKIKFQKITLLHHTNVIYTPDLTKYLLMNL